MTAPLIVYSAELRLSNFCAGRGKRARTGIVPIASGAPVSHLAAEAAALMNIRWSARWGLSCRKGKRQE